MLVVMLQVEVEGIRGGLAVRVKLNCRGGAEEGTVQDYDAKGLDRRTILLPLQSP